MSRVADKAAYFESAPSTQEGLTPEPLCRRSLRSRNLSASDEGSSLVHDQPRRFDISVDRAASSQLTTLRGRDVAFDGAVHNHGFGPDLALDHGMFSNSKAAIRIDLAFHGAVNQ